MRGLQLFVRVVQDTVQQIDVDSTVVFRAGSRHPHPAFANAFSPWDNEFVHGLDTHLAEVLQHVARLAL
eukprot:2647697-Heterocapsa_arctica.AAC.1